MDMLLRILTIIACVALAKYAKADVLVSENTYGVETVAESANRLYVSPILGMQSLTSNGSMESSGKLGYGVQAGVLVSDQILFVLGYSHSEMGLSLPSNGSPLLISGVSSSEVFSYSKNSLDLGARLFLFDRDTRVRPFLGANASYSFNKLNYNSSILNQLYGSPNYTRDFNLNQLSACGSVGVEVALTSAIVIHTEAGLEGVLGYWSPTDASTYDSNKLIAANSLSRATSYRLGLGLGLYL